MGTSKKEIFTDKQNRLAALAKAMGHPARIAILQYLIDQEDCICGDIVDEIGLAQSTVSQHLKELKNAGLIKGEVAGVKVCYCIDWTFWNQAKKDLFGFIDQEQKNCC